MAKNAEVVSGISSATKSAKNLPFDIAEDIEVVGNGDGSDNESVKRSPFSKKPNGLTG